MKQFLTLFREAGNPTGGSTSTPSQLGENKKIVQRFNTAFIQQGYITAFYEIIDPQVINHTAPPGLSKGADGMRDLILLFRSSLPDLQVEILEQVAEGDLVVTCKAFHATHTAALMGIPPSGQKIIPPNHPGGPPSPQKYFLQNKKINVILTGNHPADGSKKRIVPG